MKKKMIELGMGVFILAAAYFLGSTGGKLASQSVMAGVTQTQEGNSDSKNVIVIDAGHGGDDPGKVGINAALEKDLNLAISKKLQKILNDMGLSTVMTRENQNGLYESGTSNKKQQDMKKRCAVIDAANPVFTVSIHQNSYTSESVSGPQVFYYSQSLEGQEIAKYIQNSLNEQLEIKRPREIKANDSYYLLKKTKNPTLIVECGFLSNWDDAKKLVTDEYQQKVAKAIAGGVEQYLKQ